MGLIRILAPASPIKGRGRQPQGESARAQFGLLVPISSSLTHTHPYAGSWLLSQRPARGGVTLLEDATR
jgi:hypothetical protein